VKRGTITISLELKKKLDALGGSKTWEEFLTELLNTALEAKGGSWRRSSGAPPTRGIPLSRSSSSG
jgi:hypothetical protein